MGQFNKILKNNLLSIINHIDAGVIVTNTDIYKLCYINEKTRTFIADDTINTIRSFLEPPEDYFKNVGRLKISGNTNIEALKWEKKNDNEYYFINQCFINWKDDEPVALFTINKITNLKQSLTESIDESSILDEIYNNLPFGVVITDHYRRIKQYNNGFLRMFNLEHNEDIKGQQVRNVVMLENYAHEEITRSSDDKNKFTYKDKTNDNRIIYRTENLIKLTNKKFILSTYIDITDIEKNRIEEAQSNKSKSGFLANMSHEIRTPLNGVVGMADVLQNSVLPPEQQEYAAIIKKSADLLLTIINDVLDFSKIEAGKMTLEEIPFRLREDIQMTVDAFKVKAKEKGLSLSTYIDPRVPNNVIGDPYRIRQVISNLVGNAIKFTEQGKVVVSVEFVRDNFGMIIILFAVEDTGIGIPKEKIGKIFQSFSQADGSTTRKYGGTGLGTTISKQLVEMMEGELWVESPSAISTSPKYPGSRFSFTLELMSDEKYEKDVEVKSINELSQLKTLIIDKPNNKQNRLSESLTKANVPIEMVSDTEEALKLLRSQYIKNQRHRIIFIEDAIDFDGIKVAKAIEERDLAKKYIIIVVSSNDENRKYAICRKNKVDYYLVKPYESIDIIEILRENFPNLQIEDENIIKTEKLRKDIEILVAEDSLINQKVAETIFRNLGYEIEIAENGRIAVNMLENKKYDIIFMDSLMPELDGLQTTKELRAKGFKLPIIAMTGNTSDEDKQEAFAAGMDDYITKPVMTDVVRNILMKWFSE